MNAHKIYFNNINLENVNESKNIIKNRSYNDKMLGYYKTLKQSPYISSVIYLKKNVIIFDKPIDIELNPIDNHKRIAILLKDRYPKAKYHYLFLPLISEVILNNNIEQFPNTVVKFQYYHYPYLRAYHFIIKKLKKYLEQKLNHNFICVYHTVPSQYDLHIHIISSDVTNETFTNHEYYLTIDEVEDKLIKEYFQKIVLKELNRINITLSD